MHKDIFRCIIHFSYFCYKSAQILQSQLYVYHHVDVVGAARILLSVNKQFHKGHVPKLVYARNTAQCSFCNKCGQLQVVESYFSIAAPSYFNLKYNSNDIIDDA